MTTTAAEPTYRINDDMVTRWAFLVVNINRTLFEVHRPGCRDLLKASYPLKKYALTHNGDANTAPADGPDEAAVARIIAAQFYGGDSTAVDQSDVRRMPCLRCEHQWTRIGGLPDEPEELAYDKCLRCGKVKGLR